MDPNPFIDPPLGLILVGLVMVLFLAAAIYALGAWGAGKMRQGRIEDSSARADAPERVVSQEQVDAIAVGEWRRVVSQTPTRSERPIDAADRERGQAPGDPNPL